MDTTCPDLYPLPRPGAASLPLPCCSGISVFHQTNTAKYGLHHQAPSSGSGKRSLCPFNKYSQTAFSVPDPGLTEGSLPRCGPAPREGSCPYWSLRLEGMSVCPGLTLCFAFSFSHFSLLEGSIPSGQGDPHWLRHRPGCF